MLKTHGGKPEKNGNSRLSRTPKTICGSQLGLNVIRIEFEQQNPVCLTGLAPIQKIWKVEVGILRIVKIEV